MGGIVRSAMARALAIAGAALFFLAAATVGLRALYLHLLTLGLSPAAGLGVVALILFVLGIAMLATARAPAQAPNAAPTRPAADPLAPLRRAVADDPIATTLAAVAAGFAADSSPELRRLVQLFLSQR